MAAPMEEGFLAAVQFSKANLGVTTIKLKDKQIETLKALYNGEDCIAILPTGYGKSLIFQLLPWFLQYRSSMKSSAIVIVVCPLNSIMQDQVESLVEKGIKACFLNVTSSELNVGTTYELAPSVDQNEEGDEVTDETSVSVFCEKNVSMTDLKNGVYTIVYAHPETLISNKVIGRLLRSKVYKERVGCIVVDEVHMVAEWGNDFRKAFGRLSEIVALFGDALHLVVTATLTETKVSTLSDNLQLKKPTIVKMNPDRENIFIEKRTRLPNLKKYEKFDDIIRPLCVELMEQKSQFPMTLIYVDGLESLYYCYNYVDKYMGDNGYLPDSEQIPENRIFAQYHSKYTNLL